ncbi:hypothetical protein ENSA5_69020 [Enhygromyxa salina]|uniref:Uncharacterized protein n=1 Tax=Enhygromyxa salina TaxID=215803 RepID=A0A2S9XB78_9BACT|nr:hypothetical protein [Enhygromyxa salina]PRP89961.1 hypothetical protein ENSA5_69020 [Enhygromyxa salina]
MSNDKSSRRPIRAQRSAAALANDDGRHGWAPILAAVTIDLADFATAGPLGLVAGLAVGGALTTFVALISGVRPARALLLGLFGALYCALPLTEPIPMATMLTLLHGFLLRRGSPEPELVPAPARVVQTGPARPRQA